MIPRKCIKTHADLEVFKQTHAFQTLITFLTELNDGVRGKAVSSEYECSEVRGIHAPAAGVIRHTCVFVFCVCTHW